MFCKKCGNPLDGDQAFCNKCGVAVKPSCDAQAPTAKAQPDESSVCFTFIRHKSIARLDLSHIVTEIEMNNTEIGVEQQKVIFYFFKKDPTYTEISIRDISHVSVKGSFDISDTLFAVILTIFALISMNLWLILGAGVLMWIGYGKKIEIITKKRKRILIPAESNNNWSDFVRQLTNRNSTIKLVGSKPTR